MTRRYSPRRTWRVALTAGTTLAAITVTWHRPDLYWSALICGFALAWELLLGERERSLAEPILAAASISLPPDVPVEILAHRVEADSDAITLHEAPNKVERLPWGALSMVIIETNAFGPIIDDLHWILVGQKPEQCWRIANGSTGIGTLLGRLQQLPGFDNDAVIDAMSSIDDSRVLVWQRAKQAGVVA